MLPLASPPITPSNMPGIKSTIIPPIIMLTISMCPPVPCRLTTPNTAPRKSQVKERRKIRRRATADVVDLALDSPGWSSSSHEKHSSRPPTHEKHSSRPPTLRRINPANGDFKTPTIRFRTLLLASAGGSPDNADAVPDAACLRAGSWRTPGHEPDVDAIIFSVIVLDFGRIVAGGRIVALRGRPRLLARLCQLTFGEHP